MSRDHTNLLVRQLRQLAGPATEPGADGPLLERFIRQRDEAAFAALLQRHGAMVLGVCRSARNG